MELPKEGRLEFPTGMIRTIVALQNLVDTLKEEGPKTMQGTKIVDAFGDVG